MSGLHATRTPHPVSYEDRVTQATIAIEIHNQLKESAHEQAVALANCRVELSAVERLYQEESERRQRIESLFEQARILHAKREWTLKSQVNHLSRLVVQAHQGQ